MAYSVKLAGQDITNHVDQMSIEVDDTLGQGSGAGGSTSTQGRATTIKFNTDLGPMNKALGAGQALPGSGGPFLVRQGEIIVTDATGTIIYGGYATKYTDSTTKAIGNTKQNFTTVEGIDYSTSLQRIRVNEVFTGATDIGIINFIINKYAPWVNLQYMPTTPSYTFPTKTFRNTTVEQVIQTVAGITGFFVFVDFQKNLHYISPSTASSAPFQLSDQPDFILSFPHGVDDFTVDDNSAINRVFFYGGTRLSNDFTQDLSPLANGNNLVFPLAYYPSPASDGNYHVTVNSVAQTVGIVSGTGAANTFVSQGGTAQVLIDPGSRTLTFDTGHAPATCVSIPCVTATYRYNFPLSLIVTDEGSHRFFGNPYLDGAINDNTIFDLQTALQRCKVLLANQNYGLTTLQVHAWKPGIQAGMVLKVQNTIRGINGSYLVQEVKIKPLGGGNFEYDITLGAWNWSLIDFLAKIPTLATFQDNTPNEQQDTVFITQLVSNVKVHDAWTSKPNTTSNVYYARSAPLNDGKDAYPGFATVQS